MQSNRLHNYNIFAVLYTGLIGAVRGGDDSSLSAVTDERWLQGCGAMHCELSLLFLLNPVVVLFDNRKFTRFIVSTFCLYWLQRQEPIQ